MYKDSLIQILLSTEYNFAKLILMKATEELEIEFENNKLTHAYLFIGGNASERDDIVNIFSAKKGCFSEDISTINPADEIGRAGEIKIEDVRNLIHTVYLSPNGPARLAIIYNCERLNQSSGNILLKSLEEPPSYLSYILFAENDSVLATIRSRCRVFSLSGAMAEQKQSSTESIKEIFGNDFFEASTRIEKVIKEDQVRNLLERIGSYLRIKMLELKSDTLASALEELERTKQQILANANARLALECLYLKLKEIE